MLAIKLNKPQCQMLKRVGICLPLPVFHQWPAMYGIFLKLFIQQNDCCSYWRVSTIYGKL